MEKRKIVKELATIVGPEWVISDPDELTVYECDGMTYLEKALPDVVVLPDNTEQVVAVVKLCDREQLPFLPRGAGTGLSGGAIAVQGGVIIGLNRMNRILEIDLANQRAVVEPGLVNIAMTQAVVDRGYYFAPDPASQAASSIGGNVAENAGGPHCLKYGTTTMHILGLELVLASGEIVQVGGKTLDCPGYDLTGLFVGSEGTLGIATKVTVRLLRQAEAVKTLLASFRTIDAASEAVSEIIATGIIPSALEMMDRHIIKALEEWLQIGYPEGAGAVLLVDLDGPAAEIEAHAKRIEQICAQHGVLDLRIAKDEQERTLLWKGRKGAVAAVGRITHEFYLQDGVVPRTKLPQVLREVEAIAERNAFVIANVFHAGDGNLHPLICFDSRREGELQRAIAAGAEIMRLCLSVGGSITGEHGIGMEKIDFIPLMYSPDDLKAMRRVRVVFDPSLRCNPGKLLPNARTCSETNVAYRPHRVEREGLVQRY
ncbi:FAD-linked oxidase C-terminal domain-containing protein [Candidatus Methylomirabilis sp.]|uniref:FAD-linked oxidase C-terminal domain-containing protein n=1 Tax=Candidatus Methylomirabilis sp. TaxID=2032687 RepID=UPI003C75FF25